MNKHKNEQKKFKEYANLFQCNAVIYDNTTLHKTEQELIDEQVAEKLRCLSN
jgi:hypothetical protein